MADTTVRLRFRLSHRRALGYTTADTTIRSGVGEPAEFRLVAGDADKSIQKSSMLILRASGLASEQVAMAFGNSLQHALKLALARLHTGADFGEHSPKNRITPYGIGLLTGLSAPHALPDEWGPIVFPTETAPKFANPPAVKMFQSAQPERFERLLTAALKRGLQIPTDEALAYELFSASQFEYAERARFLFLLMAVEALLPRQERPPSSLILLDDIQRIIRGCQSIDTGDRNSLLGAVDSLRFVSARAGAKKLIEARLGERQYEGRSGSRFFSDCYSLRNRLVHGAGALPDADVVQTVGQLEWLVADLLSHKLLDVDA